MTASWNKEKVMFAVSILIFCLLIALILTRGPIRADSYPGLLRQPAPDKRLLSDTVELPAFLVPEAEGPVRDPFQSISEWKLAAPDPLPFPPVARLHRRVPLPGVLANVERARPPREKEKPKEVVEEGEK